MTNTGPPAGARARSTVVTAGGVAPPFPGTPAGPVGTPPQATTPIDQVGW